MQKSLWLVTCRSIYANKLAGGARLLGLVLVICQIFPGTGSLRAGEARPDWKKEWQRTVRAAKKEGQVNLYGSNAPGLVIEAGVFQKAYPEIKVVTVLVGGRIAGQRLMMERRAHKYLGDIVISGTTTLLQLHRAGVLDPIKPALILPEVLDESKWWQGKHRYIDLQGRYILMFIGNPMLGTIFYNTQLVDPKEINSFWDFLNPKWKGKMVSRDIRQPGAGSANMRFLYHNPKIGPKFIRRLFSEMNITLSRDRRQPVDWLGTGKFSICLFCYPQAVAIAQLQGLPIGEFGLLKEGAGISAHSGTMGLVNKAPHPNAAKVFINWYLSREGQLTLQKAYAKGRRGASNSLRVDISKKMVPLKQRLKEGVEYVDVETPEKADMQPIYKVFKEALAEAERRKRQ